MSLKTSKCNTFVIDRIFDKFEVATDQFRPIIFLLYSTSSDLPAFLFIGHVQHQDP